MPRPVPDPIEDTVATAGEVREPFETPVDPLLPWQAQQAERFSRAVNQGSARNQRLFRNVVVCVAGLLLLLIVAVALLAIFG